MKKVLLYYPPNKRSIAIETLCRAIAEAGHDLVVLTLTEKGPFHEELKKRGIPTFTNVRVRKNPWTYFWGHARFLARFSKQHKIDIILSHLQEGNFISILAQPFLKAKLITFRHHAESRFYAEYGKKFALKRSKGEVFLDKIINRMARKIIVPSSDVWHSMEKYEKCNMTKVLLLPYIYDFSAYPEPDRSKLQVLKNKYSCKLLLIMVSRMIVSKQHMPVFEVVNKLAAEGLSVKMIVMDDGPLRPQLESFMETHKLQDIIFLTGFKEDFVNYMAAADMLIHPSMTEASSNVVKEMGLLKKAVAVCRDVGDFNDYIVEGVNGFFLDNNNLSESIERVIRDAYQNPENLEKSGTVLSRDVVHLFNDSAENRQRFLQLLN